MRQRLNFQCEGEQLAATLDAAAGETGLLIVSGGNEIRIGAHRGMAHLAAEMADAGYPVFRFDRRGIGDSTGENAGFEGAAPDLAAAIAAFREACPSLQRIVAFGNCDAATALILHGLPVDHLVLSNIWVIEQADSLPPPAAIKARYLEKLKDPRQWLRLLGGQINLRKLASGLARLRAKPQADGLAARVGSALASQPVPATILLASKDNTALAFKDAWWGPAFASARARTTLRLVEIESASHSFASDTDHAALVAAILSACAMAT